MKISTKGRYALRVMIDLATHNTGEYIPLKEIAARQEITVKYLEQIIPALNRAGYLNSSRGNSGGYRLAMNAKNYTVGDILRATEGSLAPVACLENEVNDCSRNKYCVTLDVWKGLDKVIGDYLDSITLQDLADKQEAMEESNYSI